MRFDILPGPYPILPVRRNNRYFNSSTDKPKPFFWHTIRMLLHTLRQQPARFSGATTIPFHDTHIQSASNELSYPKITWVATAGGYLTGGVFLALTGYKMHQHSPQPTNLGTILILGGAGCIGESFRNLWKAWAIRTQLKNDLDSIHDCKVAIQSQTFRVSNYVWEDPASSQNVPSASMDSNQQSDQGSSSASCPPIERIDE